MTGSFSSGFLAGILVCGSMATVAFMYLFTRHDEYTVPDKIEPPRWDYAEWPTVDASEHECTCNCGCRLLTRSDADYCHSCGDGYHILADEHEVEGRPALRIVR